MIANAAPPETDLMDVANGDLCLLEEPVFVACGNWKDFQEFCLEHCFTKIEAKRIKYRSDIRDFGDVPPGKILVKLHGWHECRHTKRTVEWWVKEDRYTCDLATNRHRRRSEALAHLAWIGMCLAIWGAIIWLIVR